MARWSGSRWKLRVKRLRYRSEIDGSWQPYRVYLPAGYRRRGACPLVIILHGFGGDEKGGVNETVARLADERGYVLLCPRGRGNVFYDGAGDNDFFRTFEAVKRRFRIDEDRVYLIGSSMGGTGVWRLATRYPHLFAAAVPICGWSDWRLWYAKWYARDDRAGERRTVPEWRLPLLERASPLGTAENLLNLPVCILHGARDGTVDVRHSRRMFRALRRLGADVTYKEYGRSRHRGFLGKWRMVFDWFEGRRLRSWIRGGPVGPASPAGVKRRRCFPRRVAWRTNALLFDRAYWVRVDELAGVNRFARIEAEILRPGLIRVRARDVNRLTLVPPRESAAHGGVRIRIGRRAVYDGSCKGALSFRLSNGRWQPVRDVDAHPRGGLRKRRGLGGPLAHAFNGPFLVVPGRDPADVAEARAFASQWERWMLPLDDHGRPRGRCPVVPVGRLKRKDVERHNLILVGTPESNAVLERIAHALPVRIERGRVHVAGRTHTGRIGLRMVYPNPLAPERYVVIAFGRLPQRVKDLEGLPWLFPDYVIFDEERQCARTAHPRWEGYDRQVESGEIRPEEAPEDEKPPLYLPDCFLEAGFFDEHWLVSK